MGGLPISSPRLMDRSLRTFFDAEYLRLYRDRVTEVGPQLRFLARHAGLQPGCNVLDVGCGFGRHCVALAARGCRVLGLDYSLALLSVARDLASHLRPPGKLGLLCADITLLPLTRGSLFDLVLLLFATLGHMTEADAREVLWQLHARLRPGGRLFLDVLNANSPTASQPLVSCWTPVGAPGVLVHDRRLNPGDRRKIIVRRTVLAEGRWRHYLLRQGPFTQEQLCGLLQETGYSQMRIFSDWQDDCPDTAHQLVAVACR